MGVFFGNEQKQRGFTLIEIVIALAIAGLIFVVIFLAVTGAQRSRRDDARKAAVNRFISASEQFAGANSGTYAATCAATTTYDAAIQGGFPCDADATLDRNSVQYSTPNFHCNADGTFGAATATGVVAARIQLEAGSLTYCQDTGD